MTIRKGTKTDLPQVLELIKELAAYEKAADQVNNSVEQMEKDGFGKDPAYGLFVAEDPSGHVVGIAIYYYRYSTWKGKCMYLEDIVVTEQERGKGYGKMLFDQVIEEANLNNCTNMMWQVLEWNKPAINFYKTCYNANLDAEWINCKIELNQDAFLDRQVK